MPRPQHLVDIATKPRTVECRDCGKKIKITGPRTLPLCPKHREAHKQKLRQDRNNARTKPKKKTSRKGPTKKRNVRQVPDDVPNAPDVAPPVVPDPPIAAQTPVVEVEEKPVASESAPGRHKRGTFPEAVALLMLPHRSREGARVGILGNTGSGKTITLKTLLTYNPDQTLVLIHDDTKLDAQYAGAVCWSFREAPDDSQTIVFRGDVFKGTKVEPEYVAMVAVHVAQTTREPVWLVLDEVKRACTKGSMKIVSESTIKVLTEGRMLGVSLFWSNQSPIVPKEFIDQSSALVIHRMGPRALNYLDETLRFDRELLDVVPTLGTGEFVIYEEGRPWNGVIYTTPKPSAEFDHARQASTTEERNT